MSSMQELLEALVEVGAIASNNTRGVVLPSNRALAVRVLPRHEGMLQLSWASELGVNGAEVATGLTTVARIVVAIEVALNALIEAMARPAVLIREVVDGIPEREVTSDFIEEALVTTLLVNSVVVATITIEVNPSNVIDISWPIATVTSGANLVRTKVDVSLSSERSILQLVAIERRA